MTKEEKPWMERPLSSVTIRIENQLTLYVLIGLNDYRSQASKTVRVCTDPENLSLRHLLACVLHLRAKPEDPLGRVKQAHGLGIPRSHPAFCVFRRHLQQAHTRPAAHSLRHCLGGSNAMQRVRNRRSLAGAA